MPKIGPFHLWRHKDSKPKRFGKVALVVGVAGATFLGGRALLRRRAANAS